MVVGWKRTRRKEEQKKERERRGYTEEERKGTGRMDEWKMNKWKDK